jgi:GT2 family glycosyltransferase
MMLRAAVFDRVGGMNPRLIAGEDEEFCLRLGKAGHRLHRLPVAMTLHDAAMTRLSQFWQRATRAGHAFAEIGRMHPPHLQVERLRAIVFGAVAPLLGIVGLFTSLWLTAAAVALIAVSYIRTVRGLHKDGIPVWRAMWFAVFFTLSKLPNLIGMMRYRIRLLRGKVPSLIEYK